MNSIGIGLIGAGFMGKCHALAFGAMKAVFGDVPRPKLEVLCDVPLAKARDAAARFGFARATDDWRALVEDPKVDGEEEPARLGDPRRGGDAGLRPGADERAGPLPGRRSGRGGGLRDDPDRLRPSALRRVRARARPRARVQRQKVIEARHLLAGIAGDAPIHPDFAAALEIERVIYAIDESGRSGRRVRLPPGP